MIKLKKHNFTNILNDYLVYASARHKKQGFETLSRNFKLHILPYFKDKNIEDLTELDIMNWQTKILKKDFSNSFNNSLYYNFSTFIQYCMSIPLIDKNIVLNVKKFPKKYEVKEHKIYGLREFRKFRRNLEKYELKQFFTFIYFYGTRPSETMAIRFSDIKGLYIHIIHSLHRRGTRELDTPKNQSSIRYIKISLLMFIRLRKLKKYYTKKYNDYNSDFFVFGGKKPLSTTTVDRYKEKAAKKANLYKITQHEFRHSCASRMIHNNTPIDYVSKSLGHSKVSTTVDIYLHQQKRKPSIIQSFLEKRINF